MSNIQQLVVITEENLRAIDDLLAYLEDSIHGKDGEAITKARKYIVEYKPLEPIISDVWDEGCISGSARDSLQTAEDKQEYLKTFNL